MPPRKLFTPPAPKPPEPKVPTNIGLEPEFKSAALRWLAKHNSNLSEFVAQTLEVHMIADGAWTPQPKKPWQEPVPGLLQKKKQ